MKEKINLLHLEDDPIDVELVRRKLRQEGINCEITHVLTREEFTEALDPNKIDLIISDHALPAFSGISALDLAQSRCPYIPFMFFSGCVPDTFKAETFRKGAITWVEKSELSHRLVPTICDILDTAGQQHKDALREKQRAIINTTVNFIVEFHEKKLWLSTAEKFIERLAAQLEVDRAYAFEDRTGDSFAGKLICRWTAQGVLSQNLFSRPRGLPGLPASLRSWTTLLKQGTLVSGSVSVLPYSERHELQARSILSIILVPVLLRDKWWGVIGLENCRRERIWSAEEREALVFVGQNFGITISEKNNMEDSKNSGL